MSHDHPTGQVGPNAMETLHGPALLAVLLAGGLAAYFLTQEPPRPPPRRAPMERAERSPAPARVREEAARRGAAPRPAVPPAPAPSTPASPDCTASIVTEPGGADVFWGTVPLGRSPVQRTAVPCGPAKLKIKHAIYADIERDVTAVQGVNFVVDEKLAPGRARLEITSVPAGAAFEVNGLPSGPTYSGTIGDEVTVTARLSGHKPWTREVKLTTRRMKIEATLERE